ncbi:CDP-glycerol glycerophosphotransferase family protein [Cytobacillus kochii]
MGLSIIYLGTNQDYETPDFLRSMERKGQLEIVEKVENGSIFLNDINTSDLLFLDRNYQFNESRFTKFIDRVLSKDNEVYQTVFSTSLGVKTFGIDIISPRIINKAALINKGINKINKPLLWDIYVDFYINTPSIYYLENVLETDRHYTVDLAITDLCEFIDVAVLKESKNKKLLQVLVQDVLKIIDNKYFTEELIETKQFLLLKSVNSLFNILEIEDIKKWGLEGYIDFIELVKDGFYEESIYYIRILRGKRHWYNYFGFLQKEIKSYPIEESLSWKITKPLRSLSKIFSDLKIKVFKLLILMISFVYKVKYIGNEVWLISERADQAEDNGYHFFKYCRETYPNKKVFYLINKDSKDLEKVTESGNVIIHSSLRHWIYMLVADKYISAWVFKETSFPIGKINFDNLFQKQVKKKKQVTLQHGVIIHNIAPYLAKEEYHQDLFISSSKIEQEIIRDTLGYDDTEIKITGLSRYDNLYDIENKKQILIMPTWRRALFQLNKSEFIKSDYYNNYYRLIRNKEFLDVIEKNNIQVKFYIHNQMQQFLEDFQFEHPNIEFLSKNETVLSEIIKESSLLITDYSSVMVDFLYMNKPVLLYQFDPYNNHHGPVKELSYSDFGEIHTTKSELIRSLISYCEKGFPIEKKYEDFSSEFFAYKDKNNSARIYQAIDNL